MDLHVTGQLVGASGFPSHPHQISLQCQLELNSHTDSWRLLEGPPKVRTHAALVNHEDDCHWLHPIDWHLQSATWRNWPTVTAQVYALDDWGRMEFMGYGQMSVPMKPGHYGHLTCPIWRPLQTNNHSTIKDRLMSQFLGIHPQLKHASLSTDKSALMTETMGSITMDVHVALRNCPAGYSV